MELENYTLSSPALSALGYLGDNRIPGALPQADMRAAPLALSRYFLFADPTFRRAIGESRRAYTTSTAILETWFLRSLDLTSCSKRVGSTPVGRYRRNTICPLSS